MVRLIEVLCRHDRLLCQEVAFADESDPLGQRLGTEIWDSILANRGFVDFLCDQLKVQIASKLLSTLRRGTSAAYDDLAREKLARLAAKVLTTVKGQVTEDELAALSC